MASPESKSQLAKLKKEFTSFKQQAEIQRSLLDKLNIGIINLKNGNIINANQRILSAIDYSCENIIGLQLRNICREVQPNGKIFRNHR